MTFADANAEKCSHQSIDAARVVCRHPVVDFAPVSSRAFALRPVHDVVGLVDVPSCRRPGVRRSHRRLRDSSSFTNAPRLTWIRQPFIRHVPRPHKVSPAPRSGRRGARYCLDPCRDRRPVAFDGAPDRDLSGTWDASRRHMRVIGSCECRDRVVDWAPDDADDSARTQPPMSRHDHHHRPTIARVVNTYLTPPTTPPPPLARSSSESAVGGTSLVA